MKDYYYILGLKMEASSDEIKTAYRKLSLKFHPDKNDGDEFFSEIFKEILEAYETLSNISKRELYDNNYQLRSKTTNSGNGFNFDPIIEFFKADKLSFEFNEAVTFSWKTINSDKVTVKPFGSVKPIDQKTYKIKDFKKPFLNFELVAENSNTGRFIKQTITINNRTYKELYVHFKKVIASENYTQKQKANQSKQRAKSQKRIGEFKTDKGIIEVELNFEGAQPAMNNKVFQNGSIAKDGKYKMGFMNNIVVLNGLVVDITSF